MELATFNVPYAPGLLMKSMCILNAFAAINTSPPISLLSPLIIWTSCGLNKSAALCSSTAHSPFLLRIANSAGTQPIGPVPVTRTLRAPNSYSLCHSITSNIILLASLIYISFLSLIF